MFCVYSRLKIEYTIYRDFIYPQYKQRWKEKLLALFRFKKELSSSGRSGSWREEQITMIQND